MAGLVKRGRIWHMRLHVPKRYLMVESRQEIVRSLRTSCRTEATALLVELERSTIQQLDAKRVLYSSSTEGFQSVGRNNVTSRKQSAPVDLADIMNVIAEMRKEMALLQEFLSESSGHHTLASSRGVPHGKTLMKLADEMAALCPQTLLGKNERQLFAWKKRWRLVAKDMRRALGEDIDVGMVDADDAEKYRDWLNDSINQGRIKPQTANAYLAGASAMLKEYHKSRKNRGYTSPFRSMRFTNPFESKSRKREVPVSVVTSVLLDANKMSGLNAEAWAIVCVCIETGCRQTEVYDLPQSAIHLDEEVPWIDVEYVLEGQCVRQIKNWHSIRRVPLVGVALEAMRRFPEGFPRYRGRATFSPCVNGFLRGRGFLPRDCSIGGLRHTFETRLKNAGVSNEDRGELMGHSIERIRGREVYGDRMSLERRAELHRKIAFARTLGSAAST